MLYSLRFTFFKRLAVFIRTVKAFLTRAERHLFLRFLMRKIIDILPTNKLIMNEILQYLVDGRLLLRNDDKLGFHIFLYLKHFSSLKSNQIKWSLLDHLMVLYRNDWQNHQQSSPLHLPQSHQVTPTKYCFFRHPCPQLNFPGLAQCQTHLSFLYFYLSWFAFS